MGELAVWVGGRDTQISGFGVANGEIPHRAVFHELKKSKCLLVYY